jgi:hypothetical protein
MAALLLALALLQAPGGRAAADFSGIDQFWRIADRLIADEDVPGPAWDSLFATPGYAALEERERRRAALELGIRAALRPAEAAPRDSLRAAGGWAARVAQHVEALVARRHELDAFRAELEQRNVLAAALARTQALLPAGSIERYGTPRVVFVFFLPDGRGYPGLIVADLTHSAARGDLDGYLAHEAVHFYYAALARERRAAGGEATPQQQAVHVLLTKLFEESVGDQFDKRPYLRKTARHSAARSCRRSGGHTSRNTCTACGTRRQGSRRWTRRWQQRTGTPHGCAPSPIR